MSNNWFEYQTPKHHKALRKYVAVRGAETPVASH